jgi:hypothetical protein
MNSPLSHYRTIASSSSAAQALRLPIIQARRVFKIETTSAVLNKSPLQPTQTISTMSSAPLTAADNSPLLLGTTCGLFDLNIDSKFALFDDFRFTDSLTDEIDFEGMLNESNPDIVYQIEEPPKYFTSNSNENDTTVSSPQPDQTTIKPKSKFAQKRKDVSDFEHELFDFDENDFFTDFDSFLPSSPQINLPKIQIPPRDQHLFSQANVELTSADKNLLGMDFLNDLEVNNAITPSTERACIKLLQSIPTAQLMPCTVAAPSTRIITNDQINQIFNENDWSKLMGTQPSPFLSEMSASLKLNSSEPKNAVVDSTATVRLDHGYVAKPVEKRKLSTTLLECEYDDDENSSMSYSRDSFSSSTGAVKRKRTRGIYRADDVTNDEEYQNYLERRIKNNQSSKISRANKKNLFNQMDWKAEELAQRNEELAVKAEKLKVVIELIRKELLQNLASNKNN